MTDFDVIIIGAGPAGYKAAARLGKGGKSVCLIEKDEPSVGGTCLNEGCIPAKNFLESAHYIKSSTYFKHVGVAIEPKDLTLNLQTLQKSTNCLIEELKHGLNTTLKHAKVTVLFDTAHFIDAHTVALLQQGRRISAEYIIIATGSKHRAHPLMHHDGKQIISSKEVFSLPKLPASILIVGAGAIGCEFASFFSALGTQVHLVEYMPTLLPQEDSDVAKTVKRAFEREGIRVDVNTQVSAYACSHSGVTVELNTSKDSLTETFETVLIAIGREPNSAELALSNANITTTRGFIDVNEHLQCTTHAHIYALGDVINTPALAHVAYHEAKCVVAHILNSTPLNRTSLFPSVTFCLPQVASVGEKERSLKQRGIAFKSKKIFFKSNAKAKIKGDDSGFLKLLYDAQSEDILGVSIIGHDATELITTFIVAMHSNMTLSALETLIVAHPTLSEIILEG